MLHICCNFFKQDIIL